MATVGFDIDNNIKPVRYGLLWKKRAKVVIEQRMIHSEVVFKNIVADLRRMKTTGQPCLESFMCIRAHKIASDFSSQATKIYLFLCQCFCILSQT